MTVGYKLSVLGNVLHVPREVSKGAMKNIQSCIRQLRSDKIPRFEQKSLFRVICADLLGIIMEVGNVAYKKTHFWNTHTRTYTTNKPAMGIRGTGLQITRYLYLKSVQLLMFYILKHCIVRGKGLKQTKGFEVEDVHEKRRGTDCRMGWV